MKAYYYVTSIRIEANNEDEANEKLCQVLADDLTLDDPSVWALDELSTEEITQ
jgi:hypothetical protein